MGGVASAEASVTSTEVQVGVSENAIAEALFYDTSTGKYVFDEEAALALGADSGSVRDASAIFQNMSVKEVSEFNRVIGFTPPSFESGPNYGARALPALLIPVLKAVGVGAATAIVNSVTKWGLSGACKKLQGRYSKFDSYCKSNNWH